MNKTLYFEGAGCVPRGEVENCRIRTAFTTDKGEKIYLELSSHEVSKYSAPSLKGFVNATFIDHAFYITGGRNDENYNSIDTRQYPTFEYTKVNILALVNRMGCSFDEVVILPDLAAYRVHAKGGGYNYGDEFQYNAELTTKRETIKQYFYDLEKSEGKRFPNLSAWADEADPNTLHIMRHFNGYNGHWVIDVNAKDWLSTMKETPYSDPGGRGIASINKK